MSMFEDYRTRTGASPEKFFKATLFQSPRLLLGLSCLEPGQEQHLHAHAGEQFHRWLLLRRGEGLAKAARP